MPNISTSKTSGVPLGRLAKSQCNEGLNPRQTLGCTAATARPQRNAAGRKLMRNADG